MGYDSFLYNVFLLGHLTAAIVGFGSSFVWPVLAAKARAMEPDKGYALTNTGLSLGKPLTTIPIMATGGFGVLLVLVDGMGDGISVWGFGQLWISLAFLLFIGSSALAMFLHEPNLKAMDALQAKLVAGDVTPSPGGPPAEVLELQDRGKQAGMYGGLLHLMFLAMMILMVWKPGA